MTYTWTDNMMRGGTPCDVDKVADNLMHLKYDAASLPTTPNSVNSAKVNASGYADFIAKVSDTSVVHYAGGSNPNIVETDVLGRTHNINADETITGIADNGIYEILKEYGLDGLGTSNLALNTSGLKMIGSAISGGDYAGAMYARENIFVGGLDHIDNNYLWSSSQVGAGINGVAYIGKNFGTSQTITNIRLYQITSANYACTSVKLQSSTNGSSWTDVQTFNSLTIGLNILTLSSPLTTQYFRLLANSAFVTSNTWQVFNIDINPLSVAEVQTLPSVSASLNGNYYTVIGVQPNKQYKVVGGAYEETTFIKRGQVTKTAGTMGTPISYAFNGYYESEPFAIASANSYTKSANIGSANVTTYLLGSNKSNMIPTSATDFVIPLQGSSGYPQVNVTSVTWRDAINIKVRGGNGALWNFVGADGTGHNETSGYAKLIVRRNY